MYIDIGINIIDEYSWIKKHEFGIKMTVIYFKHNHHVFPSQSKGPNIRFLKDQEQYCKNPTYCLLRYDEWIVP